MIALFCRIGFLDGQVNRRTKEHVSISMPAGPEAKERTDWIGKARESSVLPGRDFF